MHSAFLVHFEEDRRGKEEEELNKTDTKQKPTQKKSGIKINQKLKIRKTHTFPRKNTQKSPKLPVRSLSWSFGYLNKKGKITK